MNRGPAPLWRRLWPLVLLVAGIHVLLLQGGWRAWTPTRDRWVQHFTTRTVSVTPPAPAAAPAGMVQAGAEPSAAPAAPNRPRRAPAARRPEVPRPAAPAAQSPPAPVPAPAPAAAIEAAPAPGPSAAAPATAVAPHAPKVLAVPEPSVMRYEVAVQARGFTVAGRARLDWRHEGGRYELRLELSAPGLRERVQQSTGHITTDGLAPERFSDKSRGEQAVHFERARGRVVFSNNRPEAALVEGMQDRLSVLVQLSMLAAADPARFAPGTLVAIPTASTREAQDWVFRVVEQEELDLPGGRLPALKLERLPRREFDQKVELWLAPGKDYAPVRLRLTNPDGGTVDQRWASTDRP